jgi:hypothetical protein
MSRSSGLSPRLCAACTRHSVDYKVGLKPEELQQLIPRVSSTAAAAPLVLRECCQYEGLVVRSATKVTLDIISQAKKLKV